MIDPVFAEPWRSISHHRRPTMKWRNVAVHESLAGPRLPTWPTRYVVRCPRYIGRAANVVATAALEPNLKLDRLI
jgi:hypothetical protein